MGCKLESVIVRSDASSVTTTRPGTRRQDGMRLALTRKPQAQVNNRFALWARNEIKLPSAPVVILEEQPARCPRPVGAI